jgi:NitT/TauT family transport system ATP-binding protein
MSKIRGIIGIIKQNDGAIGLSELADEVDEDIDDLLPLVEACKLLGFARIDDSTIRLTADGKKLTLGNSSKMIRERLKELEPFRSALEMLKVRDGEGATTEELFSDLREKGIFIHGEKETNDILMKKMFLRLGVRAKLMAYDAEHDVWMKA